MTADPEFVLVELRREDVVHLSGWLQRLPIMRETILGRPLAEREQELAEAAQLIEKAAKRKTSELAPGI